MPIKKVVQNIYEKNKSKFDEIDQEKADLERRRQEYIDKWSKTTGVMNPGKQSFAVPAVLQTTPTGLAQLGSFQEQRKKELEEADKNISILGSQPRMTNELDEEGNPVPNSLYKTNRLPFADTIFSDAKKMQNQLNGDIGSIQSLFTPTNDFGSGVFDTKTGDLTKDAKFIANKIWAQSNFDPKEKENSIKDAVKYMLGGQYMDKIDQSASGNILFQNNSMYKNVGEPDYVTSSIYNTVLKSLGTTTRFLMEIPRLTMSGYNALAGNKKEALNQFIQSNKNISKPFFGSRTLDNTLEAPDAQMQAILKESPFINTANAVITSGAQMIVPMALTGGVMSLATKLGSAAAAEAAAISGAESIGANAASGVAASATEGYVSTELGAMPSLVNNTSKLVDLTGKIGVFASEKLPGFIGNKFKDAALTTLTFGGIQLDGDYQEGLNKGLTGEDLAAYTLKRTATSLAIEAISVPFIPSRWVGEGNMVKNILSAEKKQWTKSAFELGEGFFGEGAEEVLDKMKNDYIDSQLEKVNYQKQLDLYNKGLITEKPIAPKEYDWKTSFGSTAEDFLVGGISGMLFKLGPAINVLNAPTQGNALYKATQNIQAFNSKVDKMLGEGKLDKDQANSLKGFVATIQPHVKAAENKKLEGISATQWAIESAKLNEVASMMTDPNWTSTATEEEKQDAINLAQSASVNMKMLEKGYWLKDKAVNAEQINAISKFETPANQYTEEQRDAISRIGLFETKTIDLKSGNTVAPKQADGTFDNTIPQMAQQMRDGKMVFENTTGLPPVLDHAGNVIDGKKRMAKALSEGATKMDVLVPVPIQKVEQQMTDALNNGVGVSLNTNAIKQYDPETQRLIKDISAQFIQLSQTEIDKAREQDRTAAELKGTAFEAPSNVNQVTRPWYWAINQLTQAGIPEQQIPGIVAAMVGNNVSEGAIKSFMEAHKSTFAKPTRIAKVAPTSTTTTQQAPTATSVADQIRDLTNRLDEGGLSKSEAKDIKRQITDLKKSDKISNFTKIVNELESKGIAQRLDKNCP